MSHESRAYDPSVAVRRRHLRLLAACGQNADHSEAGEEKRKSAPVSGALPAMSVDRTPTAVSPLATRLD